MMKLQTKLAVAFMGSAFLVFMIWDRGTKKSELDVAPIEDHVQDQQHYDSDRIIHRSRRAAVGAKLNVVYRQFDQLQSCCSIPSLITSDALDACEANYVGKAASGSRKKAANKRPKASRNLFTSISDLFTRQNSRKAAIQRQGNKQSRIVKTGNRKTGKKTNTARGKRQAAAQKITLQSVGYTDCVFNYKNYLNDSALDLNMIEDEFVNKVDTDWKPVVQDAMYMCEEPAACASPEMINVGSGRFRSIKPTILMICMRKQMILNCPGKDRSGRDFRCNSGVASLKSLNTHTLG